MPADSAQAVIITRETRDRRLFVTEMLERYADRFAGAERVLLKPNLVSAEPYPTTTNPEVLLAAIDWFLSHGYDLIVADGPALDRRLNKDLSGHPLIDACKGAGVEFVNVYDRGWVRRAAGTGRAFKLSALPFTVDAVVSLPVLKAHFVCGLTGALKNQFGYLPQRNRLQLHSGLGNIHRRIAELNAVVRPALFIIDAVETLANAQELRWGGERKRLGRMLAGTDPVALDCYGLELLKTIDPKLAGKRPEDIKHLNFSIQLGIGSTNYSIQEQ